jgi:hypothetical protein
MARNWTKEEVEFLIRAFPSEEYDLEMISKSLSRSKNGINQKARQLGLARPSKCWTKEEVDFLIRAYPSEEYNVKEIAQLLNRTVSSIANKAIELKLSRPVPKDDSPPGYKKCSKCKVIAPLNHFHKNRNNKDGLNFYCKYCNSQYRQPKKHEENFERPVFVGEAFERPVFVGEAFERPVFVGEAFERPVFAGTKKCSRCGVEKPLAEFYKSKKSKDGHIAQCKECKNEINRKWRIT